MADRPAESTPPIEPIIYNPIGWAQLQLTGGWRRFMMLGLLYGLAVLTFHLIIYRASREHVTLSRFSASALTVMFVVSAATIFLLGTAAIKRAIQRDFTSDMIQSHRLSGMSGYTAIIGYLSGPPAQAFALTIVNWLACTILAMIGGVSPGQGLFGPTIVFVVMGCFALLCWTATTLIALSTRGTVAVTGLIVVAAMIFNNKGLQLVPALGVLLGSISIVQITAGAAIQTISTMILAAIVSQLLLSLIFFIAAARKYHRDDVIAFTPPLDLVWVLLFSVLSAIGLRSKQAAIFMGPFGPSDLRIQMIATCVFMALVCYVPVANAARRSAEWRWRKKRDPAFGQRSPAGFIYASVVGSLIVCCVLMFALSPIRYDFDLLSGPHILNATNICYAFAAFILTLITFGGMIRFVYSVTPKGLFAIILIVFVFWLAPLLGDLSIEAMSPTPITSGEERSLFFAVSPIGTWLSVFKPQRAPIAFGLLIQAGIAVGSILLARRGGARA